MPGISFRLVGQCLSLKMRFWPHSLQKAADEQREPNDDALRGAPSQGGGAAPGFADLRYGLGGQPLPSAG